MDIRSLGAGSAAAASSTPSRFYRIGYAVGYPIGLLCRPLVWCLWLLIAVPLAALRRLRAVPGRSAADPDKETPPQGWTVHGVSASGKSVARPSPACFVVEPLPRMGHIGGSICAYCLHPVPEGETVWMHAASGTVMHVRCRERELKARRATLRGD
jgi:hypothetical protein